MRLWPLDIYWRDLGRGARLAFVFALAVYMSVSGIKLAMDKPYVKEVQILQLVENHSRFGFAYTRGFNLYSVEEQTYEELGVESRVRLNLGGVPFDRNPELTAYISCPPLFPIIATVVYDLTGRNWRVVKSLLVLFGLIVLYCFLPVTARFFVGTTQVYALLFSLTPFSLMHHYYSDINLNSLVLGLSFLSYLIFIRFLETVNYRWLYLFGAVFLINVWTSFFALSIVPTLFLHLFLEKRLAPEMKVRAFLAVLAFLLVIACSLVYYYSLLPGALERLVARVVARISGVKDIPVGEQYGSIPFKLFLSRLVIRMNTHFSPIAFFLGFSGLVLSGIQLMKKQGIVRGGTDTLNVHFVNVMVFLWGLPAGVLLYSGSYVHPYFIYYFSLFFTVSSAIALAKMQDSFAQGSFRFSTQLLYSIPVLFLVMSVSRSVVKLLNLSLVDLFLDGRVPSFF